MVADAWFGIGPGAVTGFGAGAADQGSGGVTSGMGGAVTTDAGANPPLWSPDNPLFWFGALLLIAAGLITASTSVKAGPFRGSASA